MSDTDPYAAKTIAPVVVTAPVEEVKSEPETTFDVPEGSVSVIMKWVGDDVEKAKAALAVETEGKARTTLIEKLEELIG